MKTFILALMLMLITAASAVIVAPQSAQAGGADSGIRPTNSGR
jgi:hypothetical protein